MSTVTQFRAKRWKGKCAGGRWLLGSIFIPDYRKENDLRDLSWGCLWVSYPAFRCSYGKAECRCPCHLLFAPDKCAADSLRLAAKREKSLSSSSLLICQANPQYTYLWTFSYTREVNAHIRWTTFSLAVCLLQEKHHVSWNQYSWTVLCLVSKPKGDQNLLLIVQLKTIHGFYLTSNTVWNVSMTWLPKFKKRKPTDWFTVCTNST